MKTHPIYSSPRKEANEDKYGNNSDACACCGKPTSENLFIHASTHWVAVNSVNEDLSELNMESQGFFPIGSNCAKKFPKEFIFKLIKKANENIFY